MASARQGEALGREREAMVKVAREVRALEILTLAQLQKKYLELFGVETRTKNKTYLQKKLAWRIQERAEGGLSAEARSRIAELAPALLPVRTEPRQRPAKAAAKPAGALITSRSLRDPRLPAVGTVLQREYQGAVLAVEVLAQGFRYRNQVHKSLSALAKLVTGTNWNGFLFFGLIHPEEQA